MSTGYTVTLRAIAKAAGVSIGTVSLALNGGKGISSLIILGGGDLSHEWVLAAVDSHLPVVMFDHFFRPVSAKLTERGSGEVS